MAASSASDIPDSKSDYCPCNRCNVARKEGRQEVIDRVTEVTDIWLESESYIIKHCANEILKALGGKQ